MTVATGLQLAVNGYDFRAWEPDRVIAVLRDLEVEAYELQFDTQAVSALEFGRQLVASGISICGIYTSSRHALAGDDPGQARRIADECLDVAADLGCRTLLVYLGVDVRLPAAQQIERSKNALDPLLQRAARDGVTIAVENLFDIKGTDSQGNGVLRTPEGIGALVDAVPTDNFGVNFDPCNFYIAGLSGVQIAAAYRRLSERIKYLHLKDAVRVKRSDRERWPLGTSVHDDIGGDFEFAAIGDGEVGIAAVVNAVVQDGFTGYIVVEGMMEPLIDVYRAGLRAVRSYIAATKTTG